MAGNDETPTSNPFLDSIMMDSQPPMSHVDMASQIFRSFPIDPNSHQTTPLTSPIPVTPIPRAGYHSLSSTSPFIPMAPLPTNRTPTNPFIPLAPIPSSRPFTPPYIPLAPIARTSSFNGNASIAVIPTPTPSSNPQTNPPPATLAKKSKAPKVATKKPLREWTIQELLILIAAKRKEWDEVITGTSTQAKMKGRNHKWQTIAKYVKEMGVTDPIRDSTSCKKRWEKLQSDWKKIYDWEKTTPSGNPSWFDMEKDERREAQLPLSFQEELYEPIREWLPSREEVDPKEAVIMDAGRVNSQPDHVINLGELRLENMPSLISLAFVLILTE
jgi:hypothetical protein